MDATLFIDGRDARCQYEAERHGAVFMDLANLADATNLSDDVAQRLKKFAS
ncbi:MAG: hypothetical protein IPO50_04200, partial [Sphingomonadales bacterium]|nr:hypothetical protein [Sphingomonadales bacterium]